jgi:hypothetical protein
MGLVAVLKWQTTTSSLKTTEKGDLERFGAAE